MSKTPTSGDLQEASEMARGSDLCRSSDFKQVSPHPGADGAGGAGGGGKRPARKVEEPGLPILQAPLRRPHGAA